MHLANKLIDVSKASKNVLLHFWWGAWESEIRHSYNI
jgi:hypothetical protein